MKVKLLKPFCSRKVGSIVTMHPANARAYYKQGVCVAVTDEDQEWLEREVMFRGKVVETQVRTKATENATTTPEPTPKRVRKPRGKTAKRNKS